MSSEQPDSATTEFHRIADQVVEDSLSFDPVGATWMGDHRGDGRLPDFSENAQRARMQVIDGALTELDAVDDVELGRSDHVDLEILRAHLTREAFELGELRALQWNPMSWNPGTALHLLMSRDFAPAPERFALLEGRLADIPRFLSDARDQLRDMPGIHVETAIAQFEGTAQLIQMAVPEMAEQQGLIIDQGLIESAAAEVATHLAWLTDQLSEATASPRLDSRTYAGVLWHCLDDASNADVLLGEAEEHLDLVTERMQEFAAEYLGVKNSHGDMVRDALTQVAAEALVRDDTVLSIVESALQRTTDFVRRNDLVTIPETDTRVIEMPEIHRGVAVAYCDAPGPLEQADVPTYVAVSPTPNGWSPERVDSFYREYNATLLHDLTIHEAMPGHVLQLAHARQLQSATPVRRFGFSGVFVEGWAVYAEELMLDRGYAPADTRRAALAIRLQQLKMQARMAINTILDIRVHSMEMTEAEGMELMVNRGFQEEGEASGKWRRALLTAGQLPTYFVGYRAVTEIVHDLRVLHPDWSDRQVHDLMLSHGSPAPRHLRSLLGI